MSSRQPFGVFAHNVDEPELIELHPSAYHSVWDDISGAKLDPAQVSKARMEEMKELHKHGVYLKVPIEECWRETGKKPIGVRWVDINKGDDVNPEYRSRLVAKEIKVHKNC